MSTVELAKISIWKYEDLLKKAEKYDMLLEALMSKADLSWSKEWINFGSSTELTGLIKLIEPRLYDDKMQQLLMEDKRENKED